MAECNGVTSDEDIRLEELLPWIEFGCWTAIALFPFLYWVNGPAVSPDQYVMRNSLVVTAFLGAFGLRWWNWRSARCKTTNANGDGSEIIRANDEAGESSK